MFVMEPLQLDPGRTWRVEDLDFPDDYRKLIEIADGTLEVTPPPELQHELILAKLHRRMAVTAPDELLVLSGTAGISSDQSWRIPDLVVVRAAIGGERRRYLGPGDVLLAVEVVSPSTRTRDRITKPAQYASIGIPNFWRIERDPVSLTAYRLDGSVYAEIGTWAGGEVAHLTEPFVVDVAIDVLGGRS